MDSENHNDSNNQREIRDNTVEAMDTEEGEHEHESKQEYLFFNVFECDKLRVK